MLEHLPVGGKDPCPGNKSQVFAISKYRNIVPPAFRKDPRHLFHLIGTFDGPFRCNHQIPDPGGIIHLLVKHDVANIIQLYNPLQVILFIKNREYITMGFCNYLNQIAQRTFSLDRDKIGLNQL